MDTVPPVESEEALRKRAAADLAAEILAIAARARSHLSEPLPTSDHSWLYGEDGLPAGCGDFSLTDIEPALKE